jgi:hypothetical protein
MEIELREINYDGANSQDLNQNNIKELTPFKNYKSTVSDNKSPELYILKDFYDKLSAYPFVMDAMNTYYNQNQPPNITICDSLPEKPSNDDTGYWLVYRAWCRMYNADIWYNVFANLAEIVSLTPEEHNILKSCSKLTPDIIQRPAITKLLTRLNYQIGILQRNSGQQELFIKTSAKSTKHDVKVQPIINGEEALNYLLSSPTIQGVLSRNESVELFLRPWNTEVTNDNEIRVFIQDGHIKSVSQQYIYASSPVLGMMFRYNADDILAKITAKWNDITTVTKYKDAVLDMFITGDGEVELIEINCGGNGWGPAGSSLFQWAEINAVPTCKCIFAYY